MSSVDQPVVVKLSGIDDILGVLPHRIGFVPAESLVVMCLSGPRRRDQLVVRVDLPPDEHEEALCAALLQAVQRAEASGVVVACYTQSASDGVQLPRRALVEGLVERLRERGVEVVDAVLVRAGRRWSYHCRNEACCPSVGTPLPADLTPAASRYVAEAVQLGRALLPDRDALIASIRPPDSTVAQEARLQAYDRAGDAVLGLVLDAGVEGLRRRTIGLLGEVLRRWSQGTPEVSLDEAALLVMGFRVRLVRDEGMTLLLDFEPASFVGLFVQLARTTDELDAAPICTMLAWAAYVDGDGALAGVAAERALACEPDYYLAKLILSALVGMLPPEHIRKAVEDARRDLQAGREGAAFAPRAARSARPRRRSKRSR